MFATTMLSVFFNSITSKKKRYLKNATALALLLRMFAMEIIRGDTPPEFIFFLFSILSRSSFAA